MAIYFDDVQGDVASIFLSYFKRAPEFEAMQWYVSVLEGLQADPATADNAFNLLSAHIYADGVASQEVPAGPSVTDAWYVSYLYGNILGRAPDAEGQAYWTEQLQTGTIARAELVSTFIAAALATEGRDAAYLENRTFVATEFAKWENSNPQVLPTLKYDAAEVLLGVNENDATVQAALERLETSTGQVGDTWNLTTGIDTLEGTSGNDTFNAVFQTPDAADSTLTSFDSIDGGLGTDTLNIYVGEGGANAAFPSTATVKNVEIVNVYGGEDADQSLTNVANYQGVEQFWQIDSATWVSNVGDDVTVGYRNIEELFGGVLLGAGVAQANIALDNVGYTEEDSPIGAYLQVSGKALDSVNITGELNGDNFVFLAVQVGTDVRSVSISTEADAYLQVIRGEDSRPASTINTIDLSGSTGDILFYLGEDQADELVGANAALNLTFGAGDDIVIFDAQEGRGLTLRDNIDGGEGYNTLVLTNDGKLQTQEYDAIARVENFQQIVFAGDDVQVDAAELEGYELAFGGEGDVIVSNLADGASIGVGSFFGSFGAFGAEDGEAPDSVTLHAAGKNITVDVSEGTAFQLLVDATNAASIGEKGGALTLTGEGAVLFGNAAAGKFSTIDASELEGYEISYDDIAEEIPFLDIDGSGNVSIGLVLADVVLGDGGEIESVGSGMSGTVQETVWLNTDTLDLIAIGVALEGNDTANSSTYGRMDVIEGFNSDAAAGPLDYLVGEGTIAQHTLGANDTTLQLAFQSVAQASALLGAPDVLYFMFEGDTYLFSDTVGGNSGQYDNADFALKIVGEHDLADQWLPMNVD